MTNLALELQHDPGKNGAALGTRVSGWLTFYMQTEHLQQLLLSSYIPTCFLLGEEGVYLKLHITLKCPQAHVFGESILLCLSKQEKG